MFIETEKTYHPDVMNFYFELQNSSQNFVFYADQAEKGEGLTEIFMKIKGIKRVLLLKNLLFVEKEQNFDWELLMPLVMAELSDYDFENIIPAHLTKNQQRKAIEVLIQSQIRSFLVRDGGNLSVVDFENGVLYVALEGHCKGCPHAENTLKNVVESILKKYLPFVVSVQRRTEND